MRNRSERESSFVDGYHASDSSECSQLPGPQSGQGELLFNSLSLLAGRWRRFHPNTLLQIRDAVLRAAGTITSLSPDPENPRDRGTRRFFPRSTRGQSIGFPSSCLAGGASAGEAGGCSAAPAGGGNPQLISPLTRLLLEPVRSSSGWVELSAVDSNTAQLPMGRRSSYRQGSQRMRLRLAR
ncbi:hypothetical protein MRX96_007772 [Rhipicephalus microplus]